MLDLQLISTILAVFAGIGVMVAGCGYAYSSFKSGNNKYKDDLIGDLKKTLEAKEATIVELNNEKTIMITSHQGQISKLQTELAALSARFDEQGKKNEEYKMLLANRDPQSLLILNEIKNGIDKLNATHAAEKLSK